MHEAWTKRDWLIMAALTLLAAILRFYQLGETPPGFQFDEAFNAIDASQVLAGNRPIFLPANGGREPLYTYFQAGIGALFGLSAYTLRMASALWGVAAIPATYLMLRVMLRKESRLIAGFTALALSISLWHIHFSHYGIRVITMPAILCGVFTCYWLATHAERASRRILAFVAAGLLMGLSVYANPTGRFVPFILLAYTLILLWRTPDQRRLRLDAPLGGLLLSGGVAFLVFLPLGITFYRHPEFFFGHASEVSVFAQRVSGERSPLLLLGENTLRVLGMFSFVGDVDWTHGPANRPVLDWIISIPFVIGVVVWGSRLVGRNRRSDPDADALWLIALWAAAMLAPSVMSEAAPNYSRTLPSLPAVLLPIGLGLTWIVVRPWPRPWMGPALAGALCTASLMVTVNDYFVRFPQAREVYYVYDVDKADALAILKERGKAQPVYFSPLWADHPPVRFFRGGGNINTLDTADTIVLPPPGMGATYAFTGEERQRAEQLAQLWPSARLEHLSDRYGEPLLSLVSIDADAANDWPPGYAPQTPLEAAFDDGPTLLGMQASPAGPVNLFWRSEAPTYRDLTSFLHLIDADGVRVAQADKLPGNGSYTTPFWTPGERVIDRGYPELLDPCAGGEQARVVAGWYQYLADNARRPRLGAPGDTAVAGQTQLPVRAWRDDPLASAQALASIGPADVLTITLRSAALQPGAPFVADLHLRAIDDMHNVAAALTLGDHTFWQGALAPTEEIEEDESFCQRVRGRIPLSMTTASSAPLILSITDEEGRLSSGVVGEVAVQPLQRRMDAPGFAIPISATLGGEVQLVGATITPTQEALRVELVWRALVDPERRAQVFVHLLDADSQLVAQLDGAPADGYPLNQWAAGEYVVDRRTLPLSADLPSGEYTVVAGLYDELSLERWPVYDAAGQRAPDDAVRVGAMEIVR